MARGGYRDPGQRQPPSGPGKFSKRTDAQKKAQRAMSDRRPSLDTPGVQYGDVQKIEAARGIAPTSRPQQPQMRPEGEPMSGGPGLPPFLFGMDSAHPGEPATAGMGMGPGQGPEALMSQAPQDDIRDQVLSFLSQVYQNPDAAEMLNEHRARKARRTEAPAAAAPPMDQPQPGLPTDMGGVLGEEE